MLANTHLWTKLTIVSAVLHLAALSTEAAVVVTSGAGNAVPLPTNVATFSTLVTDADLTVYAEGGITMMLAPYTFTDEEGTQYTLLATANTDFDPSNGHGGFESGFYSPNGGHFAL